MALFDDFGKKMGDFAQTTVQKSKELAEITKLNYQITGEEDIIKKAYAEIGKIYFEENASKATGRTAELCSIIRTSNFNINNIRLKINEVKNISICSKCGAEVVNSKFCNECGAPMPIVASTPKVATLNTICKGCGAEISEGSAFCQNCGAKTK